MTFVSDTVAGFMAAAATPRIEGETINLGTGRTPIQSAGSPSEFLSSWASTSRSSRNTNGCAGIERGHEARLGQ